MAGQIKVDSINADSNLALKIANTTVAFIDSSGLRPTSGNVNLDATATSKFYLPSANTVAIQTAGVTGLSISSAQVVTLANALAVTSGGTGVTTSTGTGAVVLGTAPTITGATITVAATAAPAFSAYQSSATSVSNVTNTKILFATEVFDTNSNFASSRFTPTVAGYYQISAGVALNISGASIIALYVNGAQVAYNYANGISGALPSTGIISKLFYFNGSTDYIEVFSYQNTGGTVNTDTNLGGTWFTGAMVRSA